MHFLIQPRNWIFVDGYRFLSFAKNMAKYTGKNISKNVSGKYSQKLLYHAKQSVTDAKRIIQKTAEATDNLIGNIITDVVAKSVLRQ